MADILKGNYELPEQKSGESAARATEQDSEQSITEEFEQSALARLGGSMCFVMKGKTFLWTGDDVENPGS